jgi:subtilisin family serine protease
LLAVAVILALAVPVFAQVGKQLASIQQFKQNLTPAQKKLDTGLAIAAVGQKNPASVSAFAGMNQVTMAPSGKVNVQITAKVTPQLIATIQKLGGDVTYQSTRWNSISAALPVSSIEAVAAQPDVLRIAKPAFVTTSAGTVTSQGYVAHRAKQVVEQQGITGSGVNVGVLSDSCTPARLAALQASGNLPPTAYALTGQSGSGNDEGCAMMEIVYDMAPGSNQVFATAFQSPQSFADNIIALQQAGAKVIVDDVSWSDEGVFQDTVIAQAVNQVTAAGASYFSSAGNSGSVTFGNSSAYEGDFKDGGPVSGVIAGAGETGNFHDFGGGQVYDQIKSSPRGVLILQWSDPYGGACDDYDLFVTNSAGTTIKGFSAGVQDCSAGSVPDEEFSYGGAAVGDRVYVVLYSGSARALHINAWRSPLQIATTGNTTGHNAASATGTTAATYWGSAKKGVVPFTGMANPVETFSSDGPRKIFFYPDGTPITPGNYLFATNGGKTLKKPDITAADGVFTTTPGFVPFYGTSAAAPHAAGIAALVLQARPSYTSLQVMKAMTASALDNMAVGFDINGGYGVAMANGAVAYALAH